ncbi:MAG: hypothetical protein GTO63_13335 [Anaerolineae bacterium]|nr:hypothetical protein [Anaerolineae bacterium]NIN95827.1 hypothetical protein [Anaerolineae bacterium]NIQ78793.1 hypothetical protein [Anaerolineae bacterium]
MALLLALLISGCIQSMKVDIDDLLSNPERYQGRRICTEGIYVSGFEASALGASTYQVGGAVYLTAPAMWIERPDIRSRSDCFETQTTPPAEFCHATVCGLFECGGEYGHLGAYECQLRGGTAW